MSIEGPKTNGNLSGDTNSAARASAKRFAQLQNSGRSKENHESQDLSRTSGALECLVKRSLKHETGEMPVARNILTRLFLE